jgi:hypothetical protein
MIVRLDTHRVVRGDSAKVAGHASRKPPMKRSLGDVTSTLDTTTTQADRIPRALEAGSELDSGVENANRQIAILRRKNVIANQAIGILAAENRELKIALGRRAAA